VSYARICFKQKFKYTTNKFFLFLVSFAHPHDFNKNHYYFLLFRFLLYYMGNFYAFNKTIKTFLLH